MTSRGSIDLMAATATTPDEQVFAEMSGRTTVIVSLAPGYWHRASEADLLWQLSRLAKLMFVARTKEYYRIRSIDFGEPVSGERPALGARGREYHQERSDLRVEGADPAGLVTITCVGMEQWTVQLAANIKSVTDEDGFCRAVSAAATRLVEAQFRGISELKHRIYRDDPA